VNFRRVLGPALILTALSLGACSKKTVSFTSPTGHYSVRLPASHASVKTSTFVLPIRFRKIPVTAHWSTLTTEDFVFEMDHLELPPEAMLPGDQPVPLLKEVLGVWCVDLKATQEGEPRPITFAGYPAIESVLRFDLGMAPYIGGTFKTTPINFRSRALLDKNRIIIISFGMMSRWQLDAAEGTDFFNSFRYSGAP
jgi:hypothetical protein